MHRLFTLGLALLTLAACVNHDQDGDGFDNGLDCNDLVASINPDAPERCGNGIDDNCDGNIDDDGEGSQDFFVDRDLDGFGDADSESFSACPGQDGHVFTNTDCDDANAQVHPGVSDDTCDQVDNNCNGDVDEGTARLTWYRDADDDKYGDIDSRQELCSPPGDGWINRGDDCDDTNNQVFPNAPELCDGLDNDCSGITDDGGVMGSGEQCPAPTCKYLHELEPTFPTAAYWLKPQFLDEPIELVCDMVDTEVGGGGWTTFSSRDVEALGLHEFSLAAGEEDGWVGEIQDGHVIYVEPWQTFTRIENQCASTVVRVDTELPMEFTELHVWFQANYFGNDNTHLEGWGSQIAKGEHHAQCPGSVMVGTDQDILKYGGEWGQTNGIVNHTTNYNFAEVRRTRTVRWEVNGVHHGIETRPRGLGNEVQFRVNEYSIKVR